jgi:hypothetical protein
MSASSRWSPPYEENNQPTGRYPRSPSPCEPELLSQRLTRAVRRAPSLTAAHWSVLGGTHSHSASLVQARGAPSLTAAHQSVLGERGAQRPRWLVRARQRPFASAHRSHLCPPAPSLLPTALIAAPSPLSTRPITAHSPPLVSAHRSHLCPLTPSHRSHRSASCASRG